MLFADCAVLIRGGGDLATGVVHRLHTAGFAVGIVELSRPLTVRRTVAFSSAVYDGTADVEGVRAQRVDTADQWQACVKRGIVPVAIDPSIPRWLPEPRVVVDARLAKRKLDTRITDGEFVVALGPGFVAGQDCHIVVETNRGSRLGQLIDVGSAQANTGTPGLVGGRGAERVLRSPASGSISWYCKIGDVIDGGALLGTVVGHTIVAPFDGVIRGLLHPDCPAWQGLKIGDIDPRRDALCDQISDKALAIGGATLTAILGWLNRPAQP